MKEYNLGQRVVLPAVIKRCNPDKRMVVLQFPDGRETAPMTWEALESLETDAQRVIGLGTYEPHATIQIAEPPQAG